MSLSDYLTPEHKKIASSILTCSGKRRRTGLLCEGQNVHLLLATNSPECRSNHRCNKRSINNTKKLDKKNFAKPWKNIGKKTATAGNTNCIVVV
jgi:hypothetical protein